MTDKTTIKHLEQKFSFARYELITACNSNELQLYLFLKLYAINKSSAFPSAKTVTDQLGWSRAKFFDTIKKMEGKNRLTVHRESGKNNVFDITWYDELNQSGNQTGGRLETRRGVGWKSDTNKKKRTKRNKTKQNVVLDGEDLGFEANN